MSAAAELSRRLADRAEAVCRAYLSRGRRSGGYWTVGDVHNQPGRSLYVRLFGAGAGQWTDAATGEHGDLLDLIAATRGLSLAEACGEAARFLGASSAFQAPCAASSSAGAEAGIAAARRLFAAGRPVAGTLAEAYLRGRGLRVPTDTTALRFHPACFYRARSARQIWPALLAAVTADDGRVSGIQRGYLDPVAAEKAPLADPRRALGCLRGHAVRFHAATDILAAGEGVETLLAVGSVLPTLPLAACLSASCLAAFVLPRGLRRLYIACDNDPAGDCAANRLRERAAASHLEVHLLRPASKDFNDDLLRFGTGALAQRLAAQLAPDDAAKFLCQRVVG